VITRVSRLGGFVPRYAVSSGNEIDLSIPDFLEYCLSDAGTEVVACYIEGFRPGEGLRFARLVRDARRLGKDVIVYKAGRSAAGRSAASGHTAAIAGDWETARAVLSRAGATLADSFDEWTELFVLFSLLRGKAAGKGRLAAFSNAGYETVGTADRIGKGAVSLALFSDDTREKLERLLAHHRLAELQDLKNPLDLTPMAGDEAHAEVAETFLNAPEVDLVLHACVPLTTAVSLDPNRSASYVARLLPKLEPREAKPFVAVIDSGELYDPLVDAFFRQGVPVFRSADRAIARLDEWVRAKLHGASATS
jgi:acyl-CoA synthetase (NDP forming)